MIWIELSTRAEAEAVESVAELFSGLGHGGGVAIEEPLLPGDETGKVEYDPNGMVTVKTYLPEGEGSEESIRRAEEGLWHLSQIRRVEDLSVNRIAEEDWAEAWKKFFHVQRIGERTVIKPSWREYDAREGEVVLELDPGMAFGTGLHPTTRMCLQGCERLVSAGMRVLDVGTGSGILSIAAAKLGAASVLGLETDPVAVDVALKNVAMNGLDGRIRVLHGSMERLRDESQAEAAGFDLVLANIIASVIIAIALPLKEALVPGGRLITSGIIAEKEESVLEALRGAGLEIDEVMAEGDWRTVVCTLGQP